MTTTTVMSTISIQVASFVKIICFYYLAKWNTMQTYTKKVFFVFTNVEHRVFIEMMIYRILFFYFRRKSTRQFNRMCVYCQYQNTNFKINWMHTVWVRFNDIEKIFPHTSHPEKKIRILKFPKFSLKWFHNQKIMLELFWKYKSKQFSKLEYFSRQLNTYET